MNKSTAVNVILLMITLAGAVAFVVDERSKDDNSGNARLQKALRKEPAPPLEVPKDPFDEREMVTYRRILAAYSTGDFEGALTLANQILALQDVSPSLRDWLNRQWPIMMTSHGWMKIKTQDCDEASKIFYKVLGVAQVPEAQKGLGFCLRVEKNWPESASYLATYVLARPSDVEGRLIYADTLESLGRYDDAVTILEGAASAEGQDASIVDMANQRLQAMKAKAKSGATQKRERSEHFYISYREDDHEVILQSVLEMLESAVAEFSEVLGVAHPVMPIEVILYRKEEFRDVIPGGPGWAEGVFDGRMRIPVASHMMSQVQGVFATVLRHELSHAMLALRANGRAWPTWFDEGIAQYLSCRRRPCDQFRFPPTPGIFSPIEKLNQPFVTLDNVEAGRAYLHSLYMTRGIVRKKGESVFADITARVPPSGVLSSDFIAEASGWDSFAILWRDIDTWWRGKEML